MTKHNLCPECEDGSTLKKRKKKKKKKQENKPKIHKENQSI